MGIPAIFRGGRKAEFDGEMGNGVFVSNSVLEITRMNEENNIVVSENCMRAKKIAAWRRSFAKSSKCARAQWRS